eukprot:2052087-Rhodomonas_salina.2
MELEESWSGHRGVDACWVDWMGWRSMEASKRASVEWLGSEDFHRRGAELRSLSAQRLNVQVCNIACCDMLEGMGDKLDGKLRASVGLDTGVNRRSRHLSARGPANTPVTIASCQDR